jgi:hypothetical protein
MKALRTVLPNAGDGLESSAASPREPEISQRQSCLRLFKHYAMNTREEMARTFTRGGT